MADNPGKMFDSLAIDELLATAPETPLADAPAAPGRELEFQVARPVSAHTPAEAVPCRIVANQAMVLKWGRAAAVLLVMAASAYWGWALVGLWDEPENASLGAHRAPGAVSMPDSEQTVNAASDPAPPAKHRTPVAPNHPQRADATTAAPDPPATLSKQRQAAEDDKLIMAARESCARLLGDLNAHLTRPSIDRMSDGSSATVSCIMQTGSHTQPKQTACVARFKLARFSAPVLEQLVADGETIFPEAPKQAAE